MEAGAAVEEAVDKGEVACEVEPSVASNSLAEAACW